MENPRQLEENNTRISCVRLSNSCSVVQEGGNFYLEYVDNSEEHIELSKLTFIEVDNRENVRFRIRTESSEKVIFTNKKHALRRIKEWAT